MMRSPALLGVFPERDEQSAAKLRERSLHPERKGKKKGREKERERSITNSSIMRERCSSNYGDNEEVSVREKNGATANL